MKSNKKCSRGFREEDVSRFYDFIHVYSPGARVDKPKLRRYLNNFTSLIVHYKFQTKVFNTYWENAFSTFSPYKCMRAQIWPCRKKFKGQPTIIIWINLVDLEIPMLYPKVQPLCFLGSEKKIFNCVYHISVWRPSCSMARKRSNKLSIPFQQKARCEIWWILLTRFQRRRP